MGNSGKGHYTLLKRHCPQSSGRRHWHSLHFGGRKRTSVPEPPLFSILRPVQWRQALHIIRNGLEGAFSSTDKNACHSPLSVNNNSWISSRVWVYVLCALQKFSTVPSSEWKAILFRIQQRFFRQSHNQNDWQSKISITCHISGRGVISSCPIKIIQGDVIIRTSKPVKCHGRQLPSSLES